MVNSYICTFRGLDPFEAFFDVVCCVLSSCLYITDLELSEHRAVANKPRSIIQTCGQVIIHVI
jgi:hypothetical protein